MKDKYILPTAGRLLLGVHCMLRSRQKGIKFARRLLGHANISTTQRYMHLDDRELADAQDLVE